MHTFRYGPAGSNKSVGRTKGSGAGAAPALLGPLRRALVITAALVLCVPLNGGLAGRPAQAAQTPHGSGWASLSGTNQGVISKTMGRDDAAYWVRPLAGIPALVNVGQHFTAQFLPTGAEVATGAAHWGLGLNAVGHGDQLAPVPAALPLAEVNRVDYRRGSIDEWYVNGPAGLEQGFTLAERPGGDPGAPLTLALGVPSSLTGVVDRGGAGLVLTHGTDSLAYRGLTVSDATGRALPAHLDLKGGQVVVRVDDKGAQYPVTVDPFVQVAKLIASDGAAQEGFGGGMAISGSTVVFGVSSVKVRNNATQGVAYVFIAPTGPAGTLTQVAELTASDGAAGDLFGQGVAVDGNTIVVGAPNAKVGTNAFQGAAYVFVQPAGGWSGALHESAKLTSSDGIARDSLGWSVGISGGTVVTGASGAKVGGNPVQGAGYVFTAPWTGTSASPQHEVAKLTASDGAAGDQFGFSVGMFGTTVVFGAPEAKVGANAGQGAGYVFVQPVSGWSGTPTAPTHQSAKLTASDGAANSQLFSFNGAAISGTTVVAGVEQGATGSLINAGAAYVFVAPTGGWAGPQTESAKLTASDPDNSVRLGFGVGISGNIVVAGAPGAQIGANIQQGAVYVFARPPGGWTGTAAAPQNETAKLTAADGAFGDKFGAAVAISGTTMVAGATQATVGSNTFQGAGYAFQAAPAPTSIALGVSPPSPAAAGPGETLTATITPAVVGAVQFMDGSTPLGAPVAETNGTASIPVALASGAHSLSAVFTPVDQTPVTGFTGSTSPPVSYTVNVKRPLCIRICS